jgi:hypothetical protein
MYTELIKDLLGGESHRKNFSNMKYAIMGDHLLFLRRHMPEYISRDVIDAAIEYNSNQVFNGFIGDEVAQGLGSVLASSYYKKAFLARNLYVIKFLARIAPPASISYHISSHLDLIFTWPDYRLGWLSGLSSEIETRRSSKKEIMEYCKQYGILPTLGCYRYVTNLADFRLLYESIGPPNFFEGQVTYTQEDVKWAIHTMGDKLQRFFGSFMNSAVTNGDFDVIDTLLASGVSLPTDRLHIELKCIPGLIKRGIVNPQQLYDDSVSAYATYSSKKFQYVLANASVIKQIGLISNKTLKMPDALARTLIMVFNELHHPESYLEFMTITPDLLAIAMSSDDTYLLKLLASRMTCKITPADSVMLYWSGVLAGIKIWRTGIDWLDEGIEKINTTNPELVKVFMNTKSDARDWRNIQDSIVTWGPKSERTWKVPYYIDEKYSYRGAGVLIDSRRLLIDASYFFVSPPQ